jgi:hypothetical protein
VLLVVGIWAGVAVMGAAGAVAAMAYEDAANGFSITPPEGWEKVPDSALQQLADKVFKDNNHPQWVVAFQKPAKTLAYPYIIVQLTPYTGGKIPGEADLENMVNKMTKVPVRKLKEKMSDAAGKALGDASLGDAVYDSENHSFVLRFTMDVAGVGKIRAVSYGFFVQRGTIVSANCYSRDDEAGLYEAEFAKCAGSFRFYPGFEYHPPEDHTVLRSAVIGGLVGGVAALVAVLRKKAKRSAAGTGEKPADPTPSTGA